MKDEILIEIHRAKDIIVYLNELKRIINILKLHDVIRENMLDRIREIKEILKEAKIKESGG